MCLEMQFWSFRITLNHREVLKLGAVYLILQLILNNHVFQPFNLSLFLICSALLRLLQHGDEKEKLSVI